MRLLKKILSDCFTGKDNHTYDHSKILGAISFIIYFALSMMALYKGHPWAPLEFSGGISAMAVSFGINLKLKQPTDHNRTNLLEDV